MLSFVEDKSVDSISLRLFHKVENSAEIRSGIFKSGLSVCLLRPQCVYDTFQLSVAITKALQNLKDGTMKTRVFGTEVLYWMSPSTNISESLKNFGASDEDKELLLICTDSDYTRVKGITTIQGEELPLEQLDKFRNMDKIAEIYNTKELGEEYREDGALLGGSIVSKMMAKEFL